MNKLFKFFYGLFLLLNPFKKKNKITIIGPDWVIYKDNVNFKHVPRQGEKIFFEDNTQLFDIRRIIHYNKDGWHIIYIMIAPHDYGKVEIDFDFSG